MTDRRAQSLTESILVLPLFLLFMFGVLQMAQIGVSFLMVNYAASSLARKVAGEYSFSATATRIPVRLANQQSYRDKANHLMVAGMQLDAMLGCVSAASPTAELTVAVRSKISAWPFFAEVVHAGLQDTLAPPPLQCPDLGNSAINFSAESPYYFYVTGRSTVRLNYVQ